MRRRQRDRPRTCVQPCVPSGRRCCWEGRTVLLPGLDAWGLLTAPANSLEVAPTVGNRPGALLP
eukprot:13184998-Heterocapsa_arctica.AAC.1